jgi:hypothetical protein
MPGMEPKTVVQALLGLGVVVALVVFGVLFLH